ncbi:M48 family peptidase [Hymenobacter gummosus]|uniref:M48 family peptidase n=1 Tax=Hymenobacter gummosus TaxID=1776032 RepID=A0A431TYT7_9BACT|nr:M48 family peptidase [Hymenobacter gummosus]
MHHVQYGPHRISYTIQERPELAAHYLSVAQHEGVVLKGPRLSAAEADSLVLKKARWILDKLALVRAPRPEDVVTGSRISYLGRSYYTQVVFVPGLPKAQVTFNHSSFRIQVAPEGDVQAAIAQALAAFFRAKARAKLAPRLRQCAAQTGLTYAALKIRQMPKRWGSCTAQDVIMLNPEVMKLPFTLIDYVLVHELCHTRVKSHNKEFWAELARHCPDWKELDKRVKDIRL